MVYLLKGAITLNPGNLGFGLGFTRNPKPFSAVELKETPEGDLFFLALGRW